MADAPERIWATGNGETGSWNNTSVRMKMHMPDGWQTEYTRLPVTIKPLVWGFRTIPEGEVGGVWMYARSIVGAYEIHTFEGRAHSGIAFLQCPNKCGLIEFPTTAEAKAAAQSDYETRIRECLE